MSDLFLNEYEILETLGHGGFADVYKVRHKELDYIRAIKVLNTLILDDQEKKYKKFLNECRLLLRLGNGSQDNIVHIARPRLLNGHALVEMEYIEGKDLDKHIQEVCGGFMPMQEIYGLLQDIGGALAYCHYDIYKYCINYEIGQDARIRKNEYGTSEIILSSDEELVRKYKVVHNDIHSKNVMRRDDGKYILLDFGLAITADAETKNSLRKEGAPEYKPPEKWDDALLLSEQSDVYSFGVLMYEALAGSVPFRLRSQSPADELALMKEHQFTVPPPIQPLRKKAFEAKYPGQQDWVQDYPGRLEALIMKCLEKKPEDRYKNGKELFEEIQQILKTEQQSQPIEAKELLDKIDALEKANIGLVQKISSADGDGRRLYEQERHFLKLTGEKQEQIKQLIEKNKYLEEILKGAAAENTVLKQKITDLNKHAPNVNSDAGQLQKSIAEKEVQIAQLAYKNKESETAISELKLENARLRKVNAELDGHKEKPMEVKKAVTDTRRFFVLAGVLAFLLIVWWVWPSGNPAEIITDTTARIERNSEADHDDIKALRKVIADHPSYKDTLIRLFAEKAIGSVLNSGFEKYENVIIALLDKSTTKNIGSDELAELGVKCSHYYGETKNGLPDGFGIADRHDTTTYIGGWQKGVRAGWGIRINKKYGETYEGDWANNMANGQGTFMSHTDDIDQLNIKGCRKYVGNFDNGMKNGFGRCYDANDKLIYEGYFKNEAPLGAYPNR